MDLPDKAPRQGPRIDSFEKKGLVILHTGGGKGKTTAALGTALRAIGRGWRVAMVQFIKGKWKTGEIKAAEKFGDQFKIFPMGEGFTWETRSFEADVRTAQKAWARCVELLNDSEHELVIFDEINYALQYNFLQTGEVLEALKKKPPLKHVILTGNGAPPGLIEIADLVTEMKCVKHPFEKGIPAQPGIEY